MKNVKIKVTDYRLYRTNCEVSTKSVSKCEPPYSPRFTIDFDFIHNSDFLDGYKSEESAWRDVKKVIEGKIQRQLEAYEEGCGVKVLNHRQLVKDVIGTCDVHLQNIICINDTEDENE
jgi:hypothetical protein